MLGNKILLVLSIGLILLLRFDSTVKVVVAPLAVALSVNKSAVTLGTLKSHFALDNTARKLVLAKATTLSTEFTGIGVLPMLSLNDTIWL